MPPDLSNYNFYIFYIYLIIFRYKGSWEKNKRHGYGENTYANGDK